MAINATLFETALTGVASDHEHAIEVNPPPAQVLYFRKFLPRDIADDFLRKLSETVNWNQETISMYGKRFPVPRLTAWYGDPGVSYTYSHIKNDPNPWTPALLGLLREVEDLTGIGFNSVLLNLYRDGNDSLSWHSDDEPELGDQPAIASVSLGASRTFSMRTKDRSRSFSVVLEHGSLLLMSGDSQKVLQHAVLKEKRLNAERINLTFRVVRGGRAS